MFLLCILIKALTTFWAVQNSIWEICFSAWVSVRGLQLVSARFSEISTPTEALSNWTPLPMHPSCEELLLRLRYLKLLEAERRSWEQWNTRGDKQKEQ